MLIPIVIKLLGLLRLKLDNQVRRKKLKLREEPIIDAPIRQKEKTRNLIEILSRNGMSILIPWAIKETVFIFDEPKYRSASLARNK